MVRPTRLHYCQYLFSTPINYTLTHFAEHSESFNDTQAELITRLKKQKVL